jgi:hypothetical protein
MVTPTRKPPAWAIVLFVVGGAALIVSSSYRWATSTAAELNEWSSGRVLVLPEWGWIALGYVCGVLALGVAVWAARRRRRWQ